MKDVFRNIFAQDTDDALVFDLASITAEDITEFKEYHGLHISAVAYLDRTRIPIGIDIGFGAMTRIKIFVTPLLTQITAPITEWNPNEGCWK